MIYAGMNLSFNAGNEPDRVVSNADTCCCRDWIHSHRGSGGKRGGMAVTSILYISIGLSHQQMLCR